MTAVTTLIKQAMKHTEGIKKRRMELAGILLYLVSMIGGNHPNGAWEIDFMSKFNYKQYLKEWDALFELIQKEHLDKGWYNPFSSRHLYNYIRILPVKVLSRTIYHTLVSNTSNHYLLANDEVDAVLNIDWLNFPVVFFEHELDDLAFIASQSKSKRMERFMMFARSGQEFLPRLREAEELVVRDWRNLNKRYKDLQKEHISTQIQAESMANMRYEMAILDALFSLPDSHSEYGKDYIETLILEDEDRVALDEFFGKPFTQMEKDIFILSTSTDPIELTMAMKSLIENRIAEREVFVLTKGFKVLVERFEYYTKLKPTDMIKPLFVENSPELIDAIKVDPEGLRETIKRLEKEKGVESKDINGNVIKNGRVLTKDSASEPKHRWIRTLDGEFFVNEDKVVVKEPVIDETTGEPKRNAETGEVIVEEKVKKVFNFIKTSLGNEAEATLTETMSVYGKTLSPEERRYVPEKDESQFINKRSGERGNIGDKGYTTEDLVEIARLKRDEIGTAHLGHRTEDKTFERIEVMAQRWADSVIARWHSEVDTLREEEEHPTVDKKDTPPTEEGKEEENKVVKEENPTGTPSASSEEERRTTQTETPVSNPSDASVSV